MIVVPALHPAHDVVVRIDTLSLGTVHRVAVEEVFAGAGGKAVNVALAIAALDVPVRLIVLGDASLLAGLEAHADRYPALEVIPFPSPVPTRTDIALVEAHGRLTVINATAPDPGTAVVEAMIGATLDGIAPDDVVVLAGSTPEGTGEAHAAIAQAATTRDARVVVDASGPALTRLLQTRPEALKVSAAEAADQPATTQEAIPIVGITDGRAGLRAWLPDGRAVRVLPPHDVQVVASLGAGDAVTAGLAIALARGDDPLDGFVLGTAMAASTLDHLGPNVDAAAVTDLRRRVRVIPLDGASTDVTT
jgi:1-phosphofructokinase